MGECLDGAQVAFDLAVMQLVAPLRFDINIVRVLKDQRIRDGISAADLLVEGRSDRNLFVVEETGKHKLEESRRCLVDMPEHQHRIVCDVVLTLRIALGALILVIC